MLRKIRITLALLFYAGITLLLLDFTGTLHTWLGWMAEVQLLPAIFAYNTLVVLILAILTLIFGRVYCSIICPLGVMQDIFGWLGSRRKGGRYRFSYSPAKNWLRWSLFILFIAAIIAGVNSFVALLAPYSSYGRIITNLFSPIYLWGNNALAWIAERFDSYAFYSVDVWFKSLPVFIIALVSFIAIGVLAWRSGRTYCNTICPVGTLLGILSRWSLLCISIDSSKCNRCGLCARRCKSACINPKEHTIDYSRCVVCMDCIDTCTHGAISFRRRSFKKTNTTTSDIGRRNFLTISAIGAAGIAKANAKKVDGGLAVILDKVVPNRNTPIVPPGAVSLRHLAEHCTGCQLCVAACPNQVLRPSNGLISLMQPECSYERGYCRPECTRCSEVCPTNAILPLTVEDKIATQIGHAVWLRENCVPLTDGVECGNCARHCPSGAILMVPSDPNNPESLKIPSIDTERCIGCGACENLCPSRPFSAIYVEGNSVHRTI